MEYKFIIYILETITRLKRELSKNVHCQTFEGSDCRVRLDVGRESVRIAPTPKLIYLIDLVVVLLM